MNIPWKVSETQSSPVTMTGANPIPTADFTAVSNPVDVRGYDWVEFTIKVVGNIGGDPVTLLQAYLQYGESSGPLAGEWFDLTTEDVGTTGEAPQNDYVLRRGISGNDVWRIPVPVHGQQMRVLLKGNGTPDGASDLLCYAYRRSF